MITLTNGRCWDFELTCTVCSLKHQQLGKMRDLLTAQDWQEILQKLNIQLSSLYSG